MKAQLLNEADFQKVAQHVQTMARPQHYQLLLLLVRDLGLRPVELCQLERAWFRGGELRIPAGYSKRGRARSLPTSPQITEALDALMGERTGRVFLNARGDTFTPGTIGDSITRMFRQAGVQACCYSGRRTLATRLVDQNVNILVVQAVLGHSSPATTLAYCGVTDGMMRRAMFG